MLTNFRIIEPSKWLVGLFSLCIATISFGQIDHWETAVYEYNTWSYLVPDAPVDEAWNTLDFDEVAVGVIVGAVAVDVAATSR